MTRSVVHTLITSSRACPRDALGGRWQAGAVLIALRRLALVIAWISTLVAGVLMTLYVFPDTQATVQAVAMASAFIPYGVFAWLVAVLFFLLGGKRWTKLFAFPALIALIVHAGWTRPYWPHPPPPAAGPSLTVMAANVRYGTSDSEATARAIRDADPDVVVLIEANETLTGSIAMRPVMAAYPHRVGRPARGATGGKAADPSATLVLSRQPLTEVAKLPSPNDQYLVHTMLGDRPLLLLAAHPMNMVKGAGLWDADSRVLADAIAPHVATTPLAVVGDLNATPEQVTFRRLTGLGLRIGAEQAGAGWQPTFTGGVEGLPPLLALDHVLTTDRVVTRAFRTVEIPRTDHYAIVAELALA